jgi:hypothetical protein
VVGGGSHNTTHFLLVHMRHQMALDDIMRTERWKEYGDVLL